MEYLGRESNKNLEFSMEEIRGIIWGGALIPLGPEL